MDFLRYVKMMLFWNLRIVSGFSFECLGADVPSVKRKYLLVNKHITKYVLTRMDQ